MDELYLFNETDKQVLAAVERLVKRLAASKNTRAAQLVSVAKVLHVLSCLPRATKGVCVTIEISYRINQEGGWNTSNWQFSVGEDWLELSCGGSEYTDAVGSDSFTTMSWTARPGERTDYDGSWDDSWMERDDEGYSDPALNAEDLSDCTISIDDDDNPLLLDKDETAQSTGEEAKLDEDSNDGN
jgi:hypothetical protein